MTRFACALALLMACTLPAAAQSPGELVRWIYTSMGQPGPAAQKGLDYLSAPERRGGYFTRAMADFFAANDSYGDDLAAACIDFGLAIPGQDYDIAEILRSLAVTEQQRGDRRVVTAQFTSFGQPARVEYEFAEEDGFLRIADIAGYGFRVSQIPCRPKAAAPSIVSATQSFCFRTGDDALRFDLEPEGRARLDLSSVQANGHGCGAQLSGGREGDSWTFHAEQGCRIELRVSAEGDVTLSDPDWVCKPMFCGQRAVIDGLRFPRSGQVDCAAWTAPR